MEANFSKEALLRFVDTAMKSGFFNPNTAGGMKAAATRLLEDVGNSEDIRHLDVEAATIKYHNKHPGELTPGSLKTYESRMKRLVGEFVKYNSDPANYKPFSRGLAKTTAERAPRGENGKTKPLVSSVVPSGTPPAESIGTAASLTTPGSLAMAYPLRENFVAQIVLPRNLTNDEARRVCAFIRTLAMDFKPED